MQNAVVEAYDGVHSNGYEPSGTRLEDRRAKGPARRLLDIGTGNGDSDSHPILVGEVPAVPVDRVVDPLGILDVDYWMSHSGEGCAGMAANGRLAIGNSLWRKWSPPGLPATAGSPYGR